MPEEDFFINRYEDLGWNYTSNQLRPAIRVNTTNGDQKEIVKRLELRGVKLEKIPFLEKAYWISKSGFSIGATSEYLLGLYSIQEAAAQIPVSLFTELKEKTVLDACAAPGGKTVQLSDNMQNTGAIIALDIADQRLKALSNHLERCHVKNTIVYRMDSRKATKLKVKFDRVLLDAPCSGNFATDKDWFKKRTLRDVERNAVLQRELLAEAAKTMKGDGELIYSTCSLEPEENELNVDWAVRTLNLETEKISCHGEKALTDVFGRKLDRSIENCRRIWPGKTQGFFICKLKWRSRK